LFFEEFLGCKNLRRMKFDRNDNGKPGKRLMRPDFLRKSFQIGSSPRKQTL